MQLTGEPPLTVGCRASNLRVGYIVGDSIPISPALDTSFISKFSGPAHFQDNFVHPAQRISVTGLVISAGLPHYAMIRFGGHDGGRVEEFQPTNALEAVK